VRAYHTNGTFQQAEIEDVTAEIKKWEEANREHLAKLAALINKLVSVVRDGGGKGVVKYVGKGNKLVVSRVQGKNMLPMDLYSKWGDGEASEKPAGEVNAEAGGRGTRRKKGKRGKTPTQTPAGNGLDAPHSG
jgi:hypothetical protein